MSDYDFYSDIEESPSTERQSMGAYALSATIAVLLFVLTAIEYFIGTADEVPPFSSNVVPLVIVALLKAALIVNFYMHINRIWTIDEDGH